MARMKRWKRWKSSEHRVHISFEKNQIAQVAVTGPAAVQLQLAGHSRSGALM